MEIKKILVSQPSPSSAKNPFSDLAEKHKVQIDFFPLNITESVSLKEFRSQRIDILAHTAVIFTSKSNIDYFFTLASAARITIPEDMKYFCITEAVALYMQKYVVYRKRKIFFGKATFADLVEVMAKHKTLKYLLPVSQNHKADMTHALTRHSLQFTKLIISQNVPSDISAINPSDYQMVVCYSGSDVKVFSEAIRVKNPQCLVATFGSAAAGAVFEAGSTVDLAVPAPAIPSIAMGIDKYLAAVKAKKDIEQFAMRTAPAKIEVLTSVNRRRASASAK